MRFYIYLLYGWTIKQEQPYSDLGVLEWDMTFYGRHRNAMKTTDPGGMKEDLNERTSQRAIHSSFLERKIKAKTRQTERFWSLVP